jgi:transposase
MLSTIYHMLKDGTSYKDLGHDYFDRGAKSRQTKRLVTRLESLGYALQITPMAA